MNKVAIKNFAIEARKKLIASVKDKAGRIGITKDTITDPISKGEGYAIFPTHVGTEAKLTGKEVKQRENLVNRIKSKENGYELVMEEVAYTWFNRLIAIRFMEVNDYLPSRVRVLSSEATGKYEPDIVTQAPDVDLEFSQAEIDEILSLKEKNAMDQLFRMLFIKQCNELGKILPELFENTSKENNDYTEILLDISYTNEDGVLRDLLKIDEADFLEAVEIIGWMYQYYISEPKDVLINAKDRYTSDEVPFVTQLFTSDWIVRYMVENSLGRLWVERYPNEELKANWHYFLEGGEENDDKVIHLEKSEDYYKEIRPEEIKVIDPCMGSGHILVYAFDVLMQIYESQGYSQRDAAKLIVEKNLYGLDIDDRAYQLAYFAIMMKGRKFDRRFLTKNAQPNLCSIQESNVVEQLDQVLKMVKLEDKHGGIDYLVSVFKNAKEFGSILNLEQRDYDDLFSIIERLKERDVDDLFFAVELDSFLAILPKLIKQAKIMALQYDVVCTNPPYLNAKYMPPKLKKYVETNYADYKNDLFTVFMIKCSYLCNRYGHIGLITPYVWMFLSSYEKLRQDIVSKRTISSLIQLEYNAFEAACVPVCTFTIRNFNSNIPGEYIKLSDFKGIEVQAPKTLEAINNRECGYRFTAIQENFSKIPGMPIAYWMSESFVRSFENDVHIKNVIDGIASGHKTANNDKYIRLWYEVNNKSDRWVMLSKGGGYRKWYGNFDSVLDWSNEARRFYATNPTSNLMKMEVCFKAGLTWSDISSYNFSCRYLPETATCETVGPSILISDNKKRNYLMGLLNSNYAKCLFNMFNPGLHYKFGDVFRIPLIVDEMSKDEVASIVEENIIISKTEWDSFETSQDFKSHPFIQKNLQLPDAYSAWEQCTQNQFNHLKENEEKINRIILQIYDLTKELSPTVEDKDITIRKANLERDIRSFLSYAVGCMFGRYSLDVEGLTYAGGVWDESKYTTFIPDTNNVLPITNDEYFTNDIVARFVEFVKMVYGRETLEENLDFIAQTLGNKGSTSREVIRNYFIKDFYADHVKVYQKRPIYWLFNSGKENGFKALIYMHRYNQDTVGRVRVDYLHKTQAYIENAISHCEVVMESNAPASEKAKAVKQKEKLVKQLAETRLYDQAIAHIAHQRIAIDLDDGVVVNYAKFQGIEVANEGKKAVKIDLLAKI